MVSKQASNKDHQGIRHAGGAVVEVEGEGVECKLAVTLKFWWQQLVLHPHMATRSKCTAMGTEPG